MILFPDPAPKLFPQYGEHCYVLQEIISNFDIIDVEQIVIVRIRNL